VNDARGEPSVARIVLMGSESTGKSTLAARLAVHYGTTASREFVREYKPLESGTLGYSDHGPIARGQMAAEDAAAKLANRLVFLDTDLFSTVVYCEHHFGRCPEWIVAEAQRRAGHLYLLMNIDVPWVADSLRDHGDRRPEMHALFRQNLEKFCLPYAEINGQSDTRFASAVRMVDALLGA
jgi:NadR type nicotinamide-nucleotide adenylyltransferase